MLLLVVMHGCGRSGGCEGPELPIAQLEGLKRQVQAGANAPKGVLILPNPIDATNSSSVLASDSRLSSVAMALGLPDLTGIQRLENEFLKVRIKSLQDDPATLAAPNAQGAYAFPVLDPHYWKRWRTTASRR